MSNESIFGRKAQYEFLANFMRAELVQARRQTSESIRFCEHSIWRMSSALAADNPNFEAVQFLKNCGLTIANCQYSNFHATTDLKLETDDHD